jgi:ABC-type sugar transport system ATPase subunit
VARREVTQAETVLELASVSKLFGTTPAVDGASLEIRRSEVFTPWGRAGAARPPR